MKRIAGKKEVGHGDWQNWLEENFNLSDRTAQQYIQIAKRFSNTQTSAVFSQSQMVELLRLPAEETEKFIAEKAAEGTPVENMTVKQTREEIQKYKAKLAEKDKECFDLQILPSPMKAGERLYPKFVDVGEFESITVNDGAKLSLLALLQIGVAVRFFIYAFI